MSTTTQAGDVLTAMTVAARLVTEIGAHRIVSVTVDADADQHQIEFHPVKPTDGLAIAESLGMKLRHILSNFATFEADIAGHRVLIYTAHPQAFVVVDSDTGEHLTGRLTRSVADAVVAAEFSRRVRVEQVTR